MPLYDFACQQCHTHFEARLAFSDEKIAACPACGSNRTDKLLSNISYHSSGATVARRETETREAPSCACGSGGCCSA